MDEHPPGWADRLLQLVLPSANRESVSGDLLEEYRDTVLPSRGRGAADVWYVLHVWSYVWRAAWPWALLFAAAFLARTAYDWRVPTTDFVMRSTVTTAVAFTTLLLAGFWTSWRTGSVSGGIIIAALVTQIAALLCAIGVTVMLTFWHDPATMAAIGGSGGLAEDYTLPFTTILPALLVGTVGGALGTATRSIR